jgi:hypothetical protein
MSFKITVEDRAQPTIGSATCDSVPTAPVAALCDSCMVNAPVALCDNCTVTVGPVALCDSCVPSAPVGPQASTAPLSPLDD